MKAQRVFAPDRCDDVHAQGKTLPRGSLIRGQAKAWARVFCVLGVGDVARGQEDEGDEGKD